MTAPLWFVFIMLGLIMSARTHITATIGGAHLDVPVLGVVALAAVLTLVVMVLFLARLVIQDGVRSRPKWATP